MRKGWEYKKLGEVGQIVTGSTPSTKDESNYSPREYCFVKPSDLPSQGIADIEETEYFVSQVGLSKSRVLPAGSVLVSCIGSIGKIGILTKEACSNQQINAIIPQDETDSRFIAYSLYAQRFVLESIANAPVVPIINKTDFSKIRIGIPPKSTQLAIVSELDKINELIRLKKEQLKDFDNLAQSLFYEMFGDPVENEKGWEVKKIKDIATEKLSYGSGASAVPFNKSVRYIRITDINEYGELKDEKVSPNIFDEKYLLAEGDILFARSGATVGKTYLHKQNEIPCIYAGYLIRLRPNELLVLPNYVYYYTKSNYYKSFICANQRVVAQPNINAKQYGDLDIPLPPLSLQRLFAQRIEQIEREKSEVQKSIQDLETLLASRMQYWFE